MTTQLPLPLSLPFNSFLSTLPPLHCGKAKRPIARSICGGKRQASQRGDTGRPRYNQMADYWTKRLEFQRHNDTHLSPSLLLPLDPRPFSHLWPSLLSIPHRRLLWEKCAETSSIHKSKCPKKQKRRQLDFRADFKLLGYAEARTWVTNAPFNILCKVSLHSCLKPKNR